MRINPLQSLLKRKDAIKGTTANTQTVHAACNFTFYELSSTAVQPGEEKAPGRP